MKLFKNANVYAPEALGRKDVLVEGTRVVKVADAIAPWEDAGLQILDLDGKTIVPGYIDLHVHLTGGGGEQGPASRTPEARLTELLNCGVTTVLGLLGTDGITRSLENLLAKVRALTEEGITCYMLTGSYGYPPVTLTGDVERDLILIPEVVGVKTAVSDHRSSDPKGDELVCLATAARRAGLLSSCCGIVTMHMGSGRDGMKPIFDALGRSDIPAKTLLPTHVNVRGKKLLDEAIEFAKMGGIIDLSTGENEEQNRILAQQVHYCLEQGVSLSSLTVSSDGYGSQPRFNVAGECIGLIYSTPVGLHQLVQLLVEEKLLDLSEALCLITKNPATVLDKTGIKGCIAPGADADFLVYDEKLQIDSVVAKGEIAVWEKKSVLKGRFE